ncbi:ADP-ribosylglycohydrolase family protein [Clostridium sp.]|uniref:ADP-ribosylglycohydrolase family protein n=1 Tax=Clostridium sp. TaxID=1506 RepID=UPI002A8463A9|nr:ADP-ribosylglycohydrolase family protein [Clostridium sp.]
MNSKLKSAILGLAIGDALGVPVEFQYREDLKLNPVVDMRAYGTHNQPAGTWSDDTSMTLCLLHSLSSGINYQDIMKKFVLWKNEGYYTPYGETFDIGCATSEAISRYEGGIECLECGGKREYDNGNGSLMRILPMTFYIIKEYGYQCDESTIVKLVHNVSALTHGHIRSKIACVIYTMIAMGLAQGKSIDDSVSIGVHRAFEYYRRNKVDEIEKYSRIEDKKFKFLKEEEIKSSGYVVDTLEAAIWCLLNTNNYSNCVLKAVNLGEDTDTVAAVAGGLAGIAYGAEDIPREWLKKLAKGDYIEEICDRLQK